eukprot:2019191-Pyramimonas_sp.AAC.1
MSCLKKKDYESAQPLVMKSIAFALGEPKGSWKARWREIESAFVDLHGRLGISTRPTGPTSC